MRPPDRTGQVWELPADGTVFLITSAPTDDEVYGWQHSTYLLIRGKNNLGSRSTSTVREMPDKHGFPADFEARGWTRLF